MDKLSIWAVSDGRAGIENQVRGLAEAVARLRPAEILVKRIAYHRGVGRLPNWVNLFPRQLLSYRSSPFESPWPDLWIGAGRASLPMSIRVRRWSSGRTFVVQTQDPRMPAGRFDLVIPPKHDQVAGDNVFSIVGAPSRLTLERLAADRARFAPAIDRLPQPRVAVLVGGRSRAFDLPPARAETMARDLERALDADGAALLMSFSRRTPERAKAILTERLGRRPGIIWDGLGDNPYYAFLAAADVIAVTEDSTNMAVEAAGTGAPVYILKMDGQSPRMRRLHDDLKARGVARPFKGAFERWTYEPLRETERAAEEIVRRLNARPAR